MDFYGDNLSFPGTPDIYSSDNFYRPNIPGSTHNGYLPDSQEDILMADEEYDQYPRAAASQAGNPAPNANNPVPHAQDPDEQAYRYYADEFKGTLVVNEAFRSIVAACKEKYNNMQPGEFDGSRQQTQDLHDYVKKALEALDIVDKLPQLYPQGSIRGVNGHLRSPKWLTHNSSTAWEDADDQHGWRHYNRILRPGLRGGAAPPVDEKSTINAPWSDVGREWRQLNKDALLPVTDIPSSLTRAHLRRPLMYRGRDMNEALRIHIAGRLSAVISDITPRYNALANSTAAEAAQQRDFAATSADAERKVVENFKKTFILPTGRGIKRYGVQGNREPANAGFLDVIQSSFNMRAWRLLHTAAVAKLYSIKSTSIAELIQAEIQKLHDLKLHEDVWKEYDGFLAVILASRDARTSARRRIQLRMQIDTAFDEDLRRFQKVQDIRAGVTSDDDGSGSGSGSAPEDPESTNNPRIMANERVLTALQRIRAANVEARNKTIEENEALSDGDVGNHQRIRLNNADIMARNNTIFSLDVEIENAKGYDPLAKNMLGFGADHKMTMIPPEEYWRDSKRIKGARKLPEDITSMSGYGPVPGYHPTPFIPNVFTSDPGFIGTPFRGSGATPKTPETIVPGRNTTDIPPPPRKPQTSVPEKEPVVPEVPEPTIPEITDPVDPVDPWDPWDNYQEQDPPVSIAGQVDNGGWTLGRILSGMKAYSNAMPQSTRDDETRSLQVWSDIFSAAWDVRGYSNEDLPVPYFGAVKLNMIKWDLGRFAVADWATFQSEARQSGLQPIPESLYYESFVYAQIEWLRKRQFNWDLAVLTSGCALVRTFGPGTRQAGRYLLTIARYLSQGRQLVEPYQKPESQVKPSRPIDPVSYSLQDASKFTFDDYVVSLPVGAQRDLEQAWQWYGTISTSARSLASRAEKGKAKPMEPEQTKGPEQTGGPYQPTQPGRPTQPGWETLTDTYNPRQWTMEEIANSTFSEFWNTLPASAKRDKRTAEEDWRTVRDSWLRLKNSVKAPSTPEQPVSVLPTPPDTIRPFGWYPRQGGPQTEDHSHPSEWTAAQWALLRSNWNYYFQALQPWEQRSIEYATRMYSTWKTAAESTQSGSVGSGGSAPAADPNKPSGSGQSGSGQPGKGGSGGGGGGGGQDPDPSGTQTTPVTLVPTGRYAVHPSQWTWAEWRDLDHNGGWDLYLAALTDVERQRPGYPEKNFYWWRNRAHGAYNRGHLQSWHPDGIKPPTAPVPSAPKPPAPPMPPKPSLRPSATGNLGGDKRPNPFDPPDPKKKKFKANLDESDLQNDPQLKWLATLGNIITGSGPVQQGPVQLPPQKPTPTVKPSRPTQPYKPPSSYSQPADPNDPGKKKTPMQIAAEAANSAVRMQGLFPNAGFFSSPPVLPQTTQADTSRPSNTSKPTTLGPHWIPSSSTQQPSLFKPTPAPEPTSQVPSQPLLPTQPPQQPVVPPIKIRQTNPPPPPQKPQKPQPLPPPPPTNQPQLPLPPLPPTTQIPQGPKPTKPKPTKPQPTQQPTQPPTIQPIIPGTNQPPAPTTQLSDEELARKKEQEEQEKATQIYLEKMMKAKLPDFNGWPEMKYLLYAYRQAEVAEQTLGQQLPLNQHGYAVPPSRGMPGYPVPVWFDNNKTIVDL